MELKGNSGCKLYIKHINNRLLVFKHSNSLSYNDRLKKQADKQKEGLNGFDKCKVVEEGLYKGLFYFAMEYINGSTIAEYMFKIELNEISDLANKLLYNFVNPEYYDNKAKDVFINKITSLKHSIGDIGNQYVLMAFRELEKFDWSYLIKSKCHGDMTLENMIISNGKIYLIDFLDSFYNSWLIDFAKILQDVELGWAYRFEYNNDSNLYVRLMIIKDILTENVLRMKYGINLMDTVYHILLLNLIRILPYIKDNTTEVFLKSKIPYLLKVINNKPWL